MVVTRSARSQAALSTSAVESSPQKKFAGSGITRSKNKEHPESKKESQSDDQSNAISQTNQKQSPILRTSKTGGRKSRTEGSLPEKIEPSTDGGISEAESNCSVSELQNTILRVTRRRKILVPCTPVSSVRKRPKIPRISESHTEEEVSEAESHVSGISRIVPSTVITTGTRKCKTKFLTDPSQESHAEDISDAESSCSDVSSFTGIASRKTTRSMQRKLKAQTKEKDSESVPENEKQIIATPVNSEDSNTRQTSQLLARSHAQINKPDFCNNEMYNDFDGESFCGNSEKILTMQKRPSFQVREGEKASITPLKEITKQNSKSLDEEAKGIIDEGKEINESSQLKNLSEPQDTGLQELASQRHSTPETSKISSESSHPNCEAIMKSLAETFAVVEVDRWDEERQHTMKTSDSTPFVDGGDSGDSDDREECTIIGVGEDMNNEKNADFESGTKLHTPEPYTSQDKDDSVLLVLSSDESQQSANSDNEEDTVCFVENGGQKESLSDQDSGNTSCDNALFVIDTTPGLSSDKNFYLEEEDKAGEVTTEEENEEQEEEEDEKSEEDLSDDDRNKDELSDEDDLLNNTKSKLLKLTSSSIDPGLSIKQLGGLYINFNADKLQSKKKTLTQIKEKKKNETTRSYFTNSERTYHTLFRTFSGISGLLQKTIITPDFEKNYCVPPYSESKFQLQKKRKKERQKTAGDGWFGMKAPELTDELKNDLKALKMRASMDPKRFYKKNDRDGFPKYFQIGTIVDNPADFYHSRIPKKQRKRTIVEELLADSEFRRYNRRKYSEIMAERTANAAGKKFRKKKKFRN